MHRKLGQHARWKTKTKNDTTASFASACELSDKFFKGSQSLDGHDAKAGPQPVLHNNPIGVSSCKTGGGAHMLQLELCPSHRERSFGLEESAELLHSLTKSITLSPDVDCFTLLHRRECLTPARHHLVDCFRVRAPAKLSQASRKRCTGLQQEQSFCSPESNRILIAKHQTTIRQ